MKFLSAKFIIPVICFTFIIFAIVSAGILSPQSNHTTASSTPYTLSDINNFILNTATTTGLNHSVSTTSSPTTTFVSISDIYANLGNLIQQERIRTGVKYLGVTGNFAIPDENRFSFSTSSKSLTPTGIPQSTGFSLADLQLLMDPTNSATTTSSTHAFSNSSQVASSMYSLSQVYTDLLTLISPTNVATGTTYLGVTGTYFPTIPNLVAHYKMNDNAVTSGTESEAGSLGTGLVAHYKMNDNAGNTTVLDTIGNFNGTASQNTTDMSVTGKMNNALNFDGAKYVYVPHNTAWNFGSDDFSISTWIYLNGGQTGEYGQSGVIGAVTNWPSGWALYMSGNDALEFRGSGWNLYFHSSTLSTSNAWTYVTITRSGNVINLYLNGVLDKTADCSDTNFQSGDGGMWIGKMSNDTSYHFTGKIDDVRIYNRALTQSEIDVLRVSGTRVADSSGNGNHGTAVQDTLALSTTGKINNALSFNGSSDSISTNLIDFISGDFSISLWQKKNGDGSYVIPIMGYSDTKFMIGYWTYSGWNALFVYASENGSSWYSGWTGSGAYGDNFRGNTFIWNNGDWHHITLTRSGTSYKFYLDGVFNGEAVGSNSLYTSNQPLIFGYSEQFANYLNGFQDDIRIYDRALTEQEVKTLYFFGDGTEEEGAE